MEHETPWFFKLHPQRVTPDPSLEKKNLRQQCLYKPPKHKTSVKSHTPTQHTHRKVQGLVAEPLTYATKAEAVWLLSTLSLGDE